MIYTTENVVAATFTNDASRPFAFREVANSGGVATEEQVTGEANAVGHYTYGSAGVQVLSMQRATTIFPEAADFLVSRIMDRWDTATKEVDEVQLSQSLLPKLQYLGSRYLFISYSSRIDYYEFALVYDTVLERWGKLRIDHVDISELPLYSIGSSYRYYTLELGYDEYDIGYDELDESLPPVAAVRENYGFLQPDGSVRALVMQEGTFGSSAVAIFGHIQLVRSRDVTVTCAELDGIFSDVVPTLTLLKSDTGFARDEEQQMQAVTVVGSYAEYHSRFTGKNIDLAIEGDFALTNMVLEGLIHGSR
jgi:hypothetical protein